VEKLADFIIRVFHETRNHQIILSPEFTSCSAAEPHQMVFTEIARPAGLRVLRVLPESLSISPYCQLEQGKTGRTEG